jgi:hypothetical protein
VGRIFLGKPWHWALWLVIVAVMVGANKVHMHVRWFGSFVLLLLGVTALIVLSIVVTYRKGEPITREPFEDL